MSRTSWRSRAGQAIPLPGTPCWVELATPDQTTAIRFYSALFGWQCTTNPDPATGWYTIASLADRHVAGLYQQSTYAPAWTVYLCVHNTRTAAERVLQLGGRITLGPADIPGRGSILHLIDASGTPVELWQLAPSWQFATHQPGTFTGADLNTHNAATTDRFYWLLFDFQQFQIGDGFSYDYAEWRLAGVPVLYRYVMGAEYPPDTPGHWVVYFNVAAGYGVDECVRRTEALGGRVAVAPYNSPFGRLATIIDPTGASFSIIDHAMTTPVQGSPNDDPYDD